MLTAKRVRALFDLDADVGLLVWRERDQTEFKRRGEWLYWNRQHAHQIAGTVHKDGYRVVSVDGKPYKAAILVWAHHTGHWPEGIVDHGNGDRLDDRPSNLEDVTHAVNMKNKATYKNNRSGVVGVYWIEKLGKWQAVIGSGGLKHLGYFVKKDDAIAARKAAEVAHGFHINHGRNVA